MTQEQYEAVMGNNPSRKTKGLKLPVTGVSWEGCQEFIKKLNKKNTGAYRLPTEAEWEYACRAGTTTVYSFGDKIMPQDANYESSKIAKPVEVGSYKPNAFGLYDMHGNVWEWCEDWKKDYQIKSVKDPKGPAFGENRVLRGGSFISPDLSASSSDLDLRLGVTSGPILWVPLGEDPVITAHPANAFTNHVIKAGCFNLLLTRLLG